MPAKPAQEPEPERTPATTARTTDTEPAKPAEDEVPEGRLPAGVYEFTGTLPTQYLEVPLTAHPETPGRDADGDEPAAPATPATVFDWPHSAPGDGRWKSSKKKPNQQPDNAPADSEGE
ncbi:hypothetical protein [Streptomyces griseorubiginosus]|uniref:hypothetical protein n=1 Tax=Streptomyces griseorubiginosus TaxID=67304 RepID=UPI0033C318F2